ncbi:NADH-quinone oxidoreductase subunit L [Derxia gummosa]|uniref:NADH-quinone oxidoreductase subunit L n=1 Tax=Derxia gummosa DSM 723 TaxID=1121388 RepID=A0A8B6X191_9BURK|nr:NADH-quinone oxidoreductase subunit L [Derxia gummosa]
MDLKSLLLVVPLAPLAGSVLAGLFGKQIGRANSHRVTILGVAIAAAIALYVLNLVLSSPAGIPLFNDTIYTWAMLGDLKLEVGFQVDSLTATMMVVVTSVSLMVHVYTIGYMEEDPGYARFFSYISLFTFSMLMLVMSNNFLQLFFGWEAVGLVSYLLIGFWYTRPTAIYANLKAFLVNRVGDFGFILGIGLILANAGTMNYAELFAKLPQIADAKIELFAGHPWSLITVSCICLFIGAMGKSAQFPLHVWLPDSMEGPTPISALIHAATMVTAGIFMVSRMSPLFELSTTALSFVLVIGSITALFMGFLGIVQNDIKRVVAYSTLSQLGYMTVALGLSAYPVAIFHLMTHAFFKALLFLAAGSVIMGMHHDQDIRHMGGLWKHMKITWFTSLIGSLALIGTPFFSGFYSKDSIIAVAMESHVPGAGFAAFAVIVGVFVTAFYSFRMFFLVFHGKERFHDLHHDHDDHGHNDHHGPLQPHESPLVVTLPLIALAIPSLFIGAIALKPLLVGHYFESVITIDHHAHPAFEEFVKADAEHGWLAMGMHAFTSLPFWLALAGVGTAAYCYLINPAVPAWFARTFAPIRVVFENKYFLDRFNEIVFAGGARAIGSVLWRVGDVKFIDGLFVNGSAKLVGWFASVIRYLQSGYIYHYAFAMIVGAVGLMTYFLFMPK